VVIRSLVLSRRSWASRSRQLLSGLSVLHAQTCLPVCIIPINCRTPICKTWIFSPSHGKPEKYAVRHSSRASRRLPGNNQIDCNMSWLKVTEPKDQHIKHHVIEQSKSQSKISKYQIHLSLHPSPSKIPMSSPSHTPCLSCNVMQSAKSIAHAQEKNPPSDTCRSHTYHRQFAFFTAHPTGPVPLLTNLPFVYC
jgi:hypothetical protein